MTPPLALIQARHPLPAPLPGPLRQRWLALGKHLGVRGRILMHPDALDVTLVAPGPALHEFLTAVRQAPGLAGFAPVSAAIDHQPFDRLTVRLLNTPAASVAPGAPPESDDQPPLCPTCLAAWLDATIEPAPDFPVGPRNPGGTGAADAPGCQHCGGRFQADLAGRIAERQRRILQIVAASPGVPPEVSPGAPEEAEPVVVVHEDPAIAIFHKPAPLPMHPSGPHGPRSMHDLLVAAYAPVPPRPAHRLDARTSGLVVTTRSGTFARFVQTQFARGEVQKAYLVRIQGHPSTDTFACDAPISTAPGPMGSRQVDPGHGRTAHTAFRVLQRDPDGSSLLEARPTTGRTHQIRVHLWHLGLPILGETLYLPGHRLGEPHAPRAGEAPLCLHAWQIGFRHPLTRRPVRFIAPEPAWARRPAGTNTTFPELLDATELGHAPRS